MSETKFTPGPWQKKNDEHGQWEVIANIDGPDNGRFHYSLVCDCDQPVDGLDSDEASANANLIAAAPELYAALEAAQFDCYGKCPVCAGWDKDSWAGENARVHNKTCIVGLALAKARGEA